MTQEQLALKPGTTRTMINKNEIEGNNVKISVIRNVIENGSGGRMQLTIRN